MGRLGMDDRFVRAVGEIAILAGRIEFAAQETAIVLIGLHDVAAGERGTKGQRFEQVLQTVDDHLGERLPATSQVLRDWVDLRPRLRDVMRLRNEYLHAHWRWVTFDPRRPLLSAEVRQRRTGDVRIECEIPAESVESVAQQFYEAETAARRLLVEVADELGLLELLTKRISYRY